MYQDFFRRTKHGSHCLPQHVTGLTEEGNQVGHHLLLKLFAHRLQDWQTAINQFLRTAYKHTL
jgi:hypothetical protein